MKVHAMAMLIGLSAAVHAAPSAATAVINIVENLAGEVSYVPAPSGFDIAPLTCGPSGAFNDQIETLLCFGGKFSTPTTGGGTSVAYMLEPDDPKWISDQIIVYWTVDNGVATVGLQFYSDGYFSRPGGGENDLGIIDPAMGVIETGALQDITGAFALSGASPVPALPEGLQIFVQSDATPDPEPASLALVALGLAGLVRRKRGKGVTEKGKGVSTLY